MLRGNNNIVLNNMQGVTNIDFYDDETSELTVDIDCLSISGYNITIPKNIYTLTDNSLKEYYLSDSIYCNAILCRFKYEEYSVYELNNKGKDMYPLYCMMIDKNKYVDIDIDIDNFIKQYTND